MGCDRQGVYMNKESVNSKMGVRYPEKGLLCKTSKALLYEV
jgi:hypothetical protein